MAQSIEEDTGRKRSVHPGAQVSMHPVQLPTVASIAAVPYNTRLDPQGRCAPEGGFQGFMWLV